MYDTSVSTIQKIQINAYRCIVKDLKEIVEIIEILSDKFIVVHEPMEGEDEFLNFLTAGFDNLIPDLLTQNKEQMKDHGGYYTGQYSFYISCIVDHFLLRIPYTVECTFLTADKRHTETLFTLDFDSIRKSGIGEIQRFEDTVKQVVQVLPKKGHVVVDQMRIITERKNYTIEKFLAIEDVL